MRGAIGTALAAALGLAAAPAWAMTFAESSAYAESVEFGDDPGTEDDSDSTSTAGDTAYAETFRCRGEAVCVFQPEWPPLGARAEATTEIGENRARARGTSGYDESIENNVIDGAYASSFWADDWTFTVAPSAAGRAVTLAFQIDGIWQNGGYARFDAGVSDTAYPGSPNPDDPDPFLLDDYVIISSLSFESSAEAITVFTAAPPFPFTYIPIDDGGDPTGSIDLGVVLEFVPEDGGTYMIQAHLRVDALSGEGENGANFGSTAELVQVVVPQGVSFVSAGNAEVEVVVPEPTAACLVAVGAAVLLAARRRRSAQLQRARRVGDS